MINAAIVGASGYSGAELMRLLLSRNDVSLAKVVARASVGQRVDALYPTFSGLLNLKFQAPEDNDYGGVDVAFVALPSGEAMNVVPNLLKDVGRVIDLSGDFRLGSAELYHHAYKHSHAAPDLLSRAVYGLPELNREAIEAARLVANPGCYPTSAVLALLPALRANIISATGIVVDSLSGVSGAGRNGSLEFNFCEVNENIRAYKIGIHQHIPEIQTVLSKATGRNVLVSFVPHLVPLTRGIYTTIHARLSTRLTEPDAYDIYSRHYETCPFVRIRQHIPQIRDVVHTNYCDIGIAIEKRTNQLIIISVLDNLVKGASGQAVQNMNIMFGLPEQSGFH